MTGADVLDRVGVVVVTYRSAAHIGACLAALPHAALAAVVVVDNASPDDTVEVVRGLRLPVELIEQGNVGFGGGCNAGWRHLADRCDWVLLLNPDAVITTTDLEVLVARARSRPRLGLVAPRLTHDGAAAFTSGRHPTLLTELRPLLPGLLGRLLPQRRTPVDLLVDGPVDYVEGAVVLARTATLAEVDGFDETFFLAFEELDLARRMQRAGWTVEVCTAATAEHVGGASRSREDFGGVDHPTRSLVHLLATSRGPRAAAVWVTAARASWWLRVRTGRMPPGERDLRLHALRTPLVAGEGSWSFRPARPGRR